MPTFSFLELRAQLRPIQTLGSSSSEDETEFKIQFQDNENEGAAARTL